MNSRIRSSSSRPTALMALLSFVVINTMATAAPFYWGQTTYSSGSIYTGDAATAANWFTSAAGGTAASSAPNSLTDDIFFNTTPANAVGGTVTVNSSFSINSASFNTSGATVFAQDSSNRNFILGAGGISLGASSGNVNLGISAATSLSVRLAASQTWSNNSANTLTVRALTTNPGNGPATLTLNSTSAGGTLFSLNINDTVAEPLAIVINSSGSGLTTIQGASNGYRGGTTVQRGALSAFGTLGSGAILLGDTTGSSNATLNIRSSTAFTNNITVRSGGSGTKTITTNQSVPVVLNGTLSLNDNLVLTNSTEGVINGDISGTGNLSKGGVNALTLAGDNTFTGDLTIGAGAFTLANTGSLTFDINGTDSNQISGSTAGAVNFNGTFDFDLLGATLVDGTTWSIVSLLSTVEIYGGTFDVTGFTQSGDIWTNGSGFSFSENTGLLSYTAVPEPTTTALLGGFFALLLVQRRRAKLA